MADMKQPTSAPTATLDPHHEQQQQQHEQREQRGDDEQHPQRGESEQHPQRGDDEPRGEDEQLDDDALAFLAELDREVQEFTKDEEISRIMKAFRANAYDVMDLQPGVPADDIKKVYRKKSLLIHPDKTKNPCAQDAFDRLAKAHQLLLDDKQRAKLDEAIADARMLLIRERKLSVDSDEVKDPDVDFIKAWKDKVKHVLSDSEARRRRQLKAQLQEQGRQKAKEEQEMEARKRKREREQEWEDTRDQRVQNWRDFTKRHEAEKAAKKRKESTTPTKTTSTSTLKFLG